ncbi:MAG: HAD hydrolase-like protein [Pseudolabrys sp.]|nr:HAD hydrolase-like protein [Pseudolabrys sp.]
MPYKLALFDFDGTLADSFPWFTTVMNDAADKFGFRRIAPEEVETLRGKSAREMIALMGVRTWKLPLIANYMRKRKAQDLDKVKLFTDAAPTLRRLHEAGVTLAIVSSNSEANIRALLGPETAALIAQYQCGASMFGKAKMFKSVLRQSGINASDAICIGDELRDLDSARAAGIAFGAVTWGYTHGAALRAQKPAHVFETFNELFTTVTGTPAQA